jgi:hypothetical protein
MPLLELQGEKRGDDHYGLGNDDRQRDETCRVRLFTRHDGKPEERQHRSIAEVKEQQRDGENDERPRLEQNLEAASLLTIAAMTAARGIIVDGVTGDHQR